MKRWIASLSLLVFLSCAPRQAPVQTPVEPPESFATAGAVEVPDRWWIAFDDEDLDHLVDRALGSNFDLAAAWFRLREARIVAEQAGSDLLPDLDAELSASVQRGEGDGDDGEEREEVLLGAGASYEVDLWGRIRSSIEAERLRAEASRLDYRSAAISLAAEVARTYFRWLEARGQLELTSAQVEANAKVEQLLENRFGGGQVRGVDVLRQRRLVESTREQQVVARSRVEVLEHLLAVLVGRPPQEGLGDRALPAATLPQVPPLPRTGLPAELVRRRPDVEAAHRRLAAAGRDVAAAVANRYPRLTLTASVTSVESDASDLFEDWIRTLAGSLLAPIFRGGELEAEVDRQEARRHQRLAEYGQATLVAFQEVEDALALERGQRERIESLEAQLRFTEQVYEQSRIEYFNGLGNYIDVLLALTDTQQLERDLLEARRILLESRVGLYRALAGGFETDGFDALGRGAGESEDAEEEDAEVGERS